MITPATPIPGQIWRQLSTRSRTVLSRAGIRSCEELLRYVETDLPSIPGCGSKTSHELGALRTRILEEIPALRDLGEEFSPGGSLPAVIDTETPARQSCGVGEADAEGQRVDPAGWSVLHRTLPELFHLCIPGLEQGGDRLPTVGEMPIPAADLERLRVAAISPEDSAAVLATVTAGYFLQAGISDDAMAIILDQLAQAAGAGRLPTAKLPAPTADICDGGLYRDMPSPPSLPVPALRYPQLFCPPAGQGGVMWQEVAKISERRVIDRLGFCTAALECIEYLWHLREIASLVIDGADAGMPTTLYGDFYALADDFLREGLVPGLVKDAERRYRLMKAVLWRPGDRRPSLRKLAQKEQVSGERIRQILLETTVTLATPRLLGRHRYVWIWIDALLEAAGGVLCAKEMAESLTKALGWKVCPPEQVIATFVCISPRYQHIGRAPSVGIAQAGHRCVRCPRMRSVLSTAAAECPQWRLPIDRALVGLSEHCREKRCPGFGKVSRFSPATLALLARVTEGLFSDGDSVYALEGPGTRSSFEVQEYARKKGSAGRAILEQIVGAAGKPVPFEEICRQLVASGCESGPTTKAPWALLQLKRSPSILPWGNAFVHRDALPAMATVVTEIEREIVTRLTADEIPYLSISGLIFKKYRERLLRETIATPYGLYCCLETLGSPDLRYPEYPYVMNREGDGVRLPVPLVLEEYLIRQNGPVAVEDMVRFGLEKLCLNKCDPRIIWQIPNSVRADSFTVVHLGSPAIDAGALAPVIECLTRYGERKGIAAGALYQANAAYCREVGIPTALHLYCLIRHFYPQRFRIMRIWQLKTRSKMGVPPENLPDVEAEALAPIVAYLAGLEQGSRITAGALYMANLPVCRELGVSTPKHLYYLMERHYPQRFPIIRKWGGPPRDRARKCVAASGISHLAERILSYLRKQAGPCPICEVAEAVRDASGKRTDLGALDRRYVLRDTQTTMVARESLDWNGQKQSAIEKLAARHLEEKEREGKAFGRCSDIFREVAEIDGLLPEIGEAVTWTPVLLHELLVSGNRFFGLGKRRDLFVAADNRHGIATLNDLAYHILLTDFDGAAPEFFLLGELDKLGIRPRWDTFRSGRDPRIVRTGKILHAAGHEVPPELIGWEKPKPTARKVKRNSAEYNEERGIVAAEIARLMETHGITPQAASKITGSGHADFYRFRLGRFKGASLKRLVTLRGKLEQHVTQVAACCAPGRVSID
ncbi:hypothetical protein GMSM_40130 [Geomonas sp. Red276]